MKKLLLLAITGIALFGCNNNKEQEKELLNQVIVVHDKVMASDEQLMNNKMMLDSLVKNNSPIINKDSAQVYLTLIDSADNAMTNWMHQFDAENKGKSHDEIVTYLGNQKTLINQIDAQVTDAVNRSERYLKARENVRPIR